MYPVSIYPYQEPFRVLPAIIIISLALELVQRLDTRTDKKSDKPVQKAFYPQAGKITNLEAFAISTPPKFMGYFGAIYYTWIWSMAITWALFTANDAVNQVIRDWFKETTPSSNGYTTDQFGTRIGINFIITGILIVFMVVTLGIVGGDFRRLLKKVHLPQLRRRKNVVQDEEGVNTPLIESPIVKSERDLIIAQGNTGSTRTGSNSDEEEEEEEYDPRAGLAGKEITDYNQKHQWDTTSGEKFWENDASDEDDE
jgi:hypothetical protein